ncbi:MAG: calcium/sodium antiporter [Actinomycetota bacterium]
MVAIVLLIIGLAVLVTAADQFVDGSVRLAKRYSVPTVVVGALVIGFGTSAPEMLVSALAAASGDRDLGVGNVVGSNVANLSLVLATAGLVAKMTIEPSVLRREAPLSVGAAALFGFFVWDGRIERWEGLVLGIGMLCAVALLISHGAADEFDADEEHLERPTMDFVRVLGGLIGTVAAAQIVVFSAIELADLMGVSGGFIGFSLVALGTSLPELVTTLASARRGETGLIAGNLLGSNVFNSLAVGGSIGLVGPGAIGDDTLSTLGVGVMMTVVLLAFALILHRQGVSRWNGVVLLVVYAAAMVILAGDAGLTA